MGFSRALAATRPCPLPLAGATASLHLVSFGASLASTWQTGIQVLIAKAFYYATAIWLLRAGGMRIHRATLLVALVLAAVEAAQTYLPGRTPEITDPILAILLGLALWILAPSHTGASCPGPR